MFAQSAEQQRFDAAIAQAEADFKSGVGGQRYLAFIGPRLTWADQQQVMRNIQKNIAAEIKATRPARDAQYAAMIARLRVAQADAERVATSGTPYEKLCQAKAMLDTKDFWSAEDYNEMTALNVLMQSVERTPTIESQA
jgi:predicted membrane chloride channel (bestrophin family)